ncbi:hypothetical protein GRJ2_002809700 [Grus japonensis]|uniref:Uncharacterized protein n=1 Tax=Grus japonensis TaxID=30415 RepID=A0ABC9Y0I7_GRUJA
MMDLLLAKAKPISDGGSASVITHLRRGGRKKRSSSFCSQRGVRRCERNNFADTKVSEEGEGGGAPGTGAEIPLQPVVKAMVRQAFIHPSNVLIALLYFDSKPMEDPKPEQVEAPEGGCDPVGSPCWSKLLAGPVERGAHTGAGLLAGLVTPMEDPCWSSLLLKVCTLWKRPMLEQFVKDCSPWEGLMLKKFVKDCLPWEGPHTGAGEEHEESSP